MATDNVVPEFDYRFAFVTLKDPKAAPGSDKEKYSVTCLVPKDQPEMLMPVRKLLKTAIVEKWGEDRKKWPASLRGISLKDHVSAAGKDGWPIRDGDAVEWDGFAGHLFFRCASNYQPGVVDGKLQAIINLDTGAQSGMLGRVQINAFAYDKAGNQGVSIGLQNVQFTRDDGVRFSGRQNAADAFTAVDTGEDDPSNYGDGDEL